MNLPPPPCPTDAPCPAVAPCVGDGPCPADAARDEAAADAAYHREVLLELIELGMGLARRVAAVPVVDGPEAAVATAGAFEQIARAVRRTVRLSQFVATAPFQRAPEVVRYQAVTREPMAERPALAGQRGCDGDDLRVERLDGLDGLDPVEAIDSRRRVATAKAVRASFGSPCSEPVWRQPAEVAASCAGAVAMRPDGERDSAPGSGGVAWDGPGRAAPDTS